MTGANRTLHDSLNCRRDCRWYSDARHRIPRPALYCTVLPPGEFNGTIPEVLLGREIIRTVRRTATHLCATCIAASAAAAADNDDDY